MSFNWSAERVEQLKQLWTDGLSASQIAAEIGEGLTRNAVLGKSHRLKLDPRKLGVSPQQSQARAVRRYRLRLEKLAAAPKPRAAPAAKPTAAVPEPLRLALADLTETTCRWPYGDVGGAEFFFCGAETGAGPYCAGHARTARHGSQG